MQKKGIMIIGGGVLQIPALKRAKSLGFTTYLADGSETCAAKKYADFFFKADTKDHKHNAAIARTLKKSGKIVAVYTQGTDVAYTVAYAAKVAGLPGIDPLVALNCNDKIRMREKLRGFLLVIPVLPKPKPLKNFCAR